MRIKASIAYDGTDYGGSQYQTNAPSIQAEVEAALEHLTGEPVRIMMAGRTDAGVHAQGQVVAFDSGWRHPIGDLQRALNAVLPRQIAVVELNAADEDFHPRYSAKSRCYRYSIYRGAVRNPRHERFGLHIARSLDVDSMAAAARALVGVHDFRAFGSPPQGNNGVREVYRADWCEEQPWLTFEIEANAFLHRMVRMIVGTLLRVGSGRMTPEVFQEILETRDRERAGPAAAAKGLSLEYVTYAPVGTG